VTDALLRLSDLRQTFRAPGGRTLQALAGVDLEIERGETVGLVGESGSGKSTLARAAMLLRRPTSGRIEFDGRDVLRMRGRELRRHRQRAQMVFQDPGDSLDPRFSVARTVAEPLRAAGIRGKAVAERVSEALDLVGLSVDALRRHPDEFSGGQRQRIAIARALVTRPEFVVLDEPTSSLDVSIQARVLNLMLALQRERHLTYLVVSHDLAVIRHLATRVAVMYLGRIVEVGPVEAIFSRPQHPYTVALLSAATRTGGGGGAAGATGAAPRERIVLRGDQPSATGVITGCAFASRCWLATDVCREVRPPLEPAERNDAGHLAACHYKGEAA
jgi:peptide/nickel transport system ATP-binding protein/oligopeptide transport system ATP-binding protein